jgi:glycosyltransferase involved in cell wall biosynthesis
MITPILTIIITTHNRPGLLPRAIDSALQQTLENIEVLVVDDGSVPPAEAPPHPRLRLLRLPTAGGGAHARNTGARKARGRLICFLDDDDELLPEMARLSVDARRSSRLPHPVSVISGLEVVDAHGRIRERRIPPSLPKGAGFFLEEIPRQQSFNSKQTLVVDKELFLGIGGFDENFRSRVHTELFVRLNAVSSLEGIPNITYRLFIHDGPRVSKTPQLRQESFTRLQTKHTAIFDAHPAGFARFCVDHAATSARAGQHLPALAALGRAVGASPRAALSHLGRLVSKKLKRKLHQVSRTKTPSARTD